MRQHGRKSAAHDAAAFLRGPPAAPRLQAPSYLDPDERRTFHQIARDAPDGILAGSDAVTLGAFVRAASTAAKASAVMTTVNSQRAVYARAIHAMCVVSAKLRLAPSSRIDRAPPGAWLPTACSGSTT